MHKLVCPVCLDNTITTDVYVLTCAYVYHAGNKDITDVWTRWHVYLQMYMYAFAKYYHIKTLARNINFRIIFVLVVEIQENGAF